jgi:hypothetical protein
MLAFLAPDEITLDEASGLGFDTLGFQSLKTAEL